MESGAQYVMTSGMILMLKWPAHSLGLNQQVRGQENDANASVTN
jgi:hypothetical protein